MTDGRKIKKTVSPRQFLVFGGERLGYAKGGFKDLVGHADSFTEAQELVRKIGVEENKPHSGLGWWQIVDMTTGEIILSHSEPTGAGEGNGPLMLFYKNGILGDHRE